MKKWLIVHSAFVVFIILSVIGCSSPIDPEPKPTLPTGGDKTAVTIAAIRGVTVPATGETPVTEITPTAQYTGTVTWNGNPSVFAASTTYTATITLTAKDGYTLQGVPANFFTVAGATTTNAVNSGVITAVFPKTGGTADNPVKIDIAAIAGVTIPVTGAAPVITITDNAQYDGTVTWKPADNPFKASTVYTAIITLTPKTGYTLEGVAANFFTVDETISTSNNTNSGVVTAVFPSTAGTTTDPVKIDIAAISGVTVPETGETPVSAITDNAQYDGTVTWSPNHSIFATSTVYTATITLTAKTGYTLQGVAANFFTVAEATSVSNDANSGVIIVVFPKTGGTAENPTAINIAAIEGVTSPATGAAPVTSITENSQYSGTVTWNGNPSTFAANTQYTATITLTPKTGFTLQGVAANFFMVTEATSVSNNANSGIVTAVFPKTVNQTPAVSDYDIGNLTQTAGSVTAVTVTPKTGKSGGTVTVLYNGSTTLPTAAGTYPITFNVAAASGWNAVNGLSAGTLTIEQAAATLITYVSISITAPVRDMVPATAATVNTGNCTAGTVTWSPADNPFKGGIAYTASVTLTAASGHTFIGLTNAHINGQAAAVSDNTGTSVKLAHVFPATDNRTVMGIGIALQPTRQVYNHGDTLNLAGLMVQVYFENGSENVSFANFAAKNITASPAHGDTLSAAAHNGQPIMITYGSQTAATSPLTVNRINPIADDFTVSGTGTFTYDGSQKTVTVTAKDDKTTGTITVKYNGSTTAPTAADTYVVTFDTAADTNYNAVSGFAAGSLTINPKVITFTIDSIPAQTYTGNAHTPLVTVKDGSTILTLNTDYTVTYTNNTNAGAASVTISGVGNYAGSSGNAVFTILQTVSQNKFEYYWVNQHGNLVTTSGGAITIAAGATLTITAQAAGYTVEQWRLDGVNTGQKGNTYEFLSMAIGKHIVGLLVRKDGKLYNTNITITVLE